MSLINGKDVCVNGVSNGGAIEVRRFSDASPVFHSSGEGGADRADGNLDFTGSYAAWGHTPAVFPNTKFTLAFTPLELGTDCGLTAANVMCTGIDINVPTFDPTGRNAVSYEVYFGMGGTDFSATSSPAPGAAAALFSTKGLACNIAGALQTDILSMQLQIRALIEGRPDSSTDGKYDRATGNIDWRLVVRKHIDSMSDNPAIHTKSTIANPIRMYVTSVLYWELTYGKVMSVHNVLDPATKEPLFTEIIVEKCTGDAGAVGTIKTPAGTTVWP